MSGAAGRVRLAVRRDLVDLPRGALVGVAVSGGADSLALLLAARAVAPALELGVVVLTVDHGWSPASAGVAAAVCEVSAAAEVLCEVLAVGPGRGGAPGGPEAGAREQRYAALDAAAERWPLRAVLLGHTLDDQAEGVLLGLARGSGARSLSGMPARREPYRRPLLGLRRAEVRDALSDPATGLAAALPGDLPPLLPWEDPSNADRSLTRARVRHDVLPVLETALGGGAVAALARSADLLRADADALDDWAGAAVEGAGLGGPERRSGVELARLAGLPLAVRARVLRLLAEAAGAGPLTAAHTQSLLDLAAAAPGSGAGPVALPGGVVARRRHGRLRLGPASSAPGDVQEP